ncbi:MAG TPA: heparinase II/III family protein, partial [Chitinolyticbacter sp.]|nr:heparinase II/III family protein [Chitinolyticbacter sp.]
MTRGLLLLAALCLAATAGAMPRGSFVAQSAAAQSEWAHAIAESAHPRSRPQAAAQLLESDGWRDFANRTRRDLSGAFNGLDGQTQIGRLRGDAKLNAQVDANQRYLPALERLRDGLLLRAYGTDEADRALVERAVDQVLAWPELGVSQFAKQDQVARQLAWVLALYVDWFHAELSPQRRAAVRQIIESRRRDIEASVLDPKQGIAAVPRNSHGWTNAGYLAAIGVLTAERGNPAAATLARVLGTYERSVAPWGGNDGGYANGTMYLYGQLGTLMEQWDVIRAASGIDLYALPWSQRVGDMLAYFTPPGARYNGFGDGSEKGVAAHIVLGWAQRVPNTVNLWMARNTIKPRVLGYLALTGPASAPPGEKLVPPPDRIQIASIGWAALHSALQERNRTSLYFKSSPYGSFNHSHADQNSFILDHRGRRLLWDSGVYDWYGSPHWRGWYKQTLAHNAVTYDGGIGQRVDDATAGGRIVQWGHGGGFDWVVGDAAPAYAAGTRQALRGIAYHRASNGFLVWDHLQAEAPRRWEWRLHSQQPFKPLGSGRWRMEGDEGIALCVTQLTGPSLTLTADDQMRPEPGRGTSQRLWHSTWQSAPSRDYTQLMWLSPDCREVEVRAGMRDGVIELQVGKETLRIAQDRFVE